MTALPTVIIDIKENVTSWLETSKTYGSNGQQVMLEKIEDPQGSGFFKFKHTKNGIRSGTPFTVKEVKYDDKTINHSQLQFNDDSYIEYIAIWYWFGDPNHNKPILIEIGEKGGTYRYYATNGSATSWIPHDKGSKSQLQPEELEQLLDDLNCQYYKLVTIDITHNKYKIGSKYCCTYHNPKGQEKVTVTRGSVNAPSRGDKDIPYYNHSIADPSFKLAKIKYKENLIHSKVKHEVYSIPVSVSNVKGVYAFYSSKRRPMLIYIEGGDSTVNNKWFQKKGSNKHRWEDASVEIKSIKPENSTSPIEYGQYNALLEVLSEFPGCGYGQCDIGSGKYSYEQDINDSISDFGAIDSAGEVGGGSGKKLLDIFGPLIRLGLNGSTLADKVGLYAAGEIIGKALGLTKNTQLLSAVLSLAEGIHTPPPRQSTPGLIKPVGGGTKGLNPDSPSEDLEPPKAALSQAPDLPPNPQPYLWFLPATGLAAYGIYGGAFAGTGTLTGLGWWIYKRSKGDPWVRQI
ncbi:hypothetical protein BEWA_032460 [Theileria equi strain WA]|uniref:Uncharacterized protein n=1 Tax=Theileria equi strain WA TaxID=1537102 RepID=L0AYU2_THEEQ|nr:hypothetical protein BEWA_032460 [Theileria equi strain WA]AFZ80393.1 hypothetical protein BEWA_032460 [Theileria equi strain WA]|eukprot:XP_004830059.1 hypothetical protein BEWA_032460 [Theileria equi strain WA]